MECDSGRAWCLLRGTFIILCSFLYSRGNINNESTFSLFLKCFKLACFQFCLQSSCVIFVVFLSETQVGVGVCGIILNILNPLGQIISLMSIIFWYRKEVPKNKQVSLVLNKSNRPCLLSCRSNKYINNLFYIVPGANLKDFEPGMH